MKTKKGSILVYSLVMLSIFLFIAIGVSSVAVSERKNAGLTEKSSQAFQAADSGLETFLKVVKTSTTIADMVSAGFVCNASDGTLRGSVSSGKDYRIIMQDIDGNQINCSSSSTPVTQIAKVKSIGINGTSVRAVEIGLSSSSGECSASTPCPGECTFDGLTYKTVVTKDGNCWLDRNLGDPKELAGNSWLFQWGRGTDGHQIPTSSTTDTLTTFCTTEGTPGHGNFIRAYESDWCVNSNSGLWQGVSGINNPCPNGFRIPAESEWVSFENSEFGRNVAWSELRASTLKISTTGTRDYGGTYAPGSIAEFWTSDPVGGMPERARSFRYDNAGNVSVQNETKAVGAAVRCIKD